LTKEKFMKPIITCLLMMLIVSVASGKEKMFTASTPANTVVRSFLGIALNDSVDFIRWKLVLQDHSYHLQCNYGIGKPNTNGFFDGGKKIEFNGPFIKRGIYYQLQYGKRSLTTVQLNENLLHIADEDNNSINHIAFSAEAHKPLAQGGYEDVFNSKFFGEKVGAYTLPHVLTEQGVPSSVIIETAGGPLTRGGKGGFNILLLYPDQGILVNYRTQMHLNGVNVRGCPANAYVQMELYPPGQPDSFFEGLKQTDWTVKMNVDYKPLEEVTSMSVQEFYDTFREPTDKCIETPAKLWPTPEP